MARTSRRQHAGLAMMLLLLAAPLAANAQLSNLPDLETATQTQGRTTQTTDESTGRQTDDATQTKEDAESTTKDNDSQITDAPDESTSTGNSLATGGTLTNSAFHLTDLPEIAGAGVPTLVIPYTANAPYMRKSTLPEGTFFIAVGATLAFLGACVLLWRGMIAWSINRSVKRTAKLASMNMSEKSGRTTSSYWGGNGGYNRVSTGPKYNSFHKDLGANSNVSLDNLTSAGKPVKPHFRDSVAERNPSSADPSQLFFSPTRQAQTNRDSQQRHSSAYMPSGYYAAPSSQLGNGHNSVPVGGLAPSYGGNSNRHSYANSSPPASPGLPPQSRGSTSAYRHSASRDGVSLHPPRSRDGQQGRNSYIGANPSSSSLMVGHQSTGDLPGQRAPSAYLDNLFDNHGAGPRERF